MSRFLRNATVFLSFVLWLHVLISFFLYFLTYQNLYHRFSLSHLFCCHLMLYVFLPPPLRLPSLRLPSSCGCQHNQLFMPCSFSPHYPISSLYRFISPFPAFLYLPFLLLIAPWISTGFHSYRFPFFLVIPFLSWSPSMPLSFRQ